MTKGLQKVVCLSLTKSQNAWKLYRLTTISSSNCYSVNSVTILFLLLHCSCSAVYPSVTLALLRPPLHIILHICSIPLLHVWRYSDYCVILIHCATLIHCAALILHYSDDCVTLMTALLWYHVTLIHCYSDKVEFSKLRHPLLSDLPPIRAVTFGQPWI